MRSADVSNVLKSAYSTHLPSYSEGMLSDVVEEAQKMGQMGHVDDAASVLVCYGRCECRTGDAKNKEVTGEAYDQGPGGSDPCGGDSGSEYVPRAGAPCEFWPSDANR